MSNHDTLISDFVQLTNGSTAQATEYLTASNWDLDAAVTGFYADMDESGDASGAPAAAEQEYTGPRTLDGRPAPEYASGSSSATSKKPARRTGVATLSSLGGHSHDDDDDDEDEDDEDDERRGPRDLFAGGEKSGLAVQDPAQRSSDPRRLINDIVAKARAARSQQPDEGAAAGPSRSVFSGAGQTLGGDGVESRRIPDPRGQRAAAQPADEGPVQERFLHLWRDGFSVDDGELCRYDDPQHSADLEMIREGRAPLHLMNVRLDQRVDVKLQQHAENYRPLPKIYRPFGGEGRRLGSPVPDAGLPTPATATTTTAASSASGSGSQAAPTGVDPSQPTLMLRIQLPDGTRLPARFNTTQTVGDVYDFVQRALAANNSRPWVVSTTFPNKDHTDKELVLGEMPEFKRGGTAVVKWA